MQTESHELTIEKLFYARLVGERVETSGALKASFGDRSTGVFAEWMWDGERIVVANDRYGFFPIYYLQRGDVFAVSSSIEALLQFDPEKKFDGDALSVFLRFGWLIGDETVFRSIRAIPPGSKLTWSRGELTIESAGIIRKSVSDISRREAIETYSELFGQAVRRSIPEGRFAVPLSGGRDSRHILLALWRAKQLPEACLTLVHPPPRPNEDARIAKILCDRIKLPHELIEQTGSRFENELEKNRLIGFGAFEHGWFRSLGRHVAGRFDAVFDGIAGDVLSAGLFLTKKRLDLFRAGKFEELADHLLEPEGYLPKMLSRGVYLEFARERAVARLANELKLHADQPNPVGSFYFWNRTRRCIAPSPFRLIGGDVRIVTPFLDAAVFDFLATLPAELLLDNSFHSETIAFAYPEFADVPYERKDSAPNLDGAHFDLFSRDVFRYAMSSRNRVFTRRSFFATRFLRGLMDRNYSRAAVEFGEQAINLLQLERL